MPAAPPALLVPPPQILRPAPPLAPPSSRVRRPVAPAVRPLPVAPGWHAGPVPTLAWDSCPEAARRGFECATATVPIDYQQPAGDSLRLALIRQRATDPARRIGTLFFLPGGPGGAGTELLPAWLGLLPAALKARFDLVSWDPRGVGASTAVRCLPPSPERRALFEGLPPGFPISPSERARWFQGYGRLAEGCEREQATLLRHLSTADSARDLDLLRAAVGDRLLSFRGSSYGTLLGATYANLFPERVRAMVLDGNVDPEAWSNGGSRTSRTTTSLRMESDLGSAATLQSFLRLCGEAGSARCPFAASGPAGPAAATEARFAALMQRLTRGPIPYRGRPLTYAAATAALTDLLVSVEPAGGFPGWAAAGRFLHTLHSGGSGGDPPPRGADLPEQALAVLCGESPNPRSPEAYPELAAKAYERSGVIGPHWPWGDAPCAVWPATATAPWLGPWNRPTAARVLVIGNRYDPVTPYQGSLAMARELGNSRLLSVNGHGHTVLLNPSACAARYEVAYLVDGLLPPEGVVCRQDRMPFAAPATP